MDISRAIYRGVCTSTNTWVMGVPIFLEEQPNIAYLINKECETVVHASSVGQFTGLRDRNGVDIYEGDIVEDDVFEYEGIHRISVGRNKYQITWHKQSASFIGIFHDSSDTYHLDMPNLSDCEVIGNNYEHIHLLK